MQMDIPKPITAVMSTSATLSPGSTGAETADCLALQDGVNTTCDSNNITSEYINEDTTETDTTTALLPFSPPKFFSITKEGSKCYWNDIPFEVRELIFEKLDELYVNEIHKKMTLFYDVWPPATLVAYEGPEHKRRAFDWDMSPPAMLEALRSIPLAHNHALQWFALGKWATCITIDLPFKCGLNKLELNSIRNLSLNLESVHS